MPSDDAISEGYEVVGMLKPCTLQFLLARTKTLSASLQRCFPWHAACKPSANVSTVRHLSEQLLCVLIRYWIAVHFYSN